MGLKQMQYRYAKLLNNGDQVIRSCDGLPFIVKDTEVFGQFKKVKINCVDENGVYETLFNDEVE